MGDGADCAVVDCDDAMRRITLPILEAASDSRFCRSESFMVVVTADTSWSSSCSSRCTVSWVLRSVGCNCGAEATSGVDVAKATKLGVVFGVI